MQPKAQIILGLAFLILPLGSIYAQDTPILDDSLYSTILGEERPLQIALPQDFDKEATTTYEIIYILDGFSSFTRIEWNFLRGEGFIPKNTILVGVRNTYKGGIDMRYRDFTPTRTDSVSGGAAKFLSFFKQELMPYINKIYHGKPGGHTLYGGSLGGLFALYVLLQDPGLFTSYMAVDPSLWWDHFYLNKLAKEKFAAVQKFHNTCWIVGREGSPYHHMGIAGMDSVLQSQPLPRLDWKVTRYSNDTHYSTNFKGFYEGLKFSYGGFYASTGGYPASRNIVLKPHYGAVLKGKPFTLYCFNLAPQSYIHYSTNGIEPTLASPRLSGEESSLTLDHDAKVILRSFCMRDEYNRSDTAFFEITQPLPALPQPSHIKNGGLHYSYYEAAFDSLSRYTSLTAVKAGIANRSFDINGFPREKDYACIMQGYIEIKVAGNYIFEMGDGNEGTRAYLADRQILGMHYKSQTGEAYLLPLEKGYYPFRVEYYHKKGSASKEWIYCRPDSVDDFPIPAEMLYSN